MARKRITGAGGYYQHNPRVPVIVTSHSQGRENAMAVAWHMAISHTPPLYGVSIAPKRYSYKLILESLEFGINFVPYDKAELIATAGGGSGHDVDKFSRFQLTKVKPLKTSVPILKDAYAAYECKLVDHRTYGDHELLVGEVLATHYDSECFDEQGILDLEQVAPTLYLGADIYVGIARESLQVLNRKGLYGKG